VGYTISHGSRRRFARRAALALSRRNCHTAPPIPATSPAAITHFSFSSHSAFAFARAATAAGSSLTLHPFDRQPAVALGADHSSAPATTQAISDFMGRPQSGQVWAKFRASGAKSLGFQAIS
jgi:hypothetical protein